MRPTAQALQTIAGFLTLASFLVVLSDSVAGLFRLGNRRSSSKTVGGFSVGKYPLFWYLSNYKTTSVLYICTFHKSGDKLPDETGS